MKLAGALTTVAALLGLQTPPAAAQQTVPASVHQPCTNSVYPREALRYELEGITTLRYRLAPDGRVADVHVAKSSGWQLLDDAAIRTIQACVFNAGQAASTAGAELPVKYVWSLEGNRVRPHLVPGSCAASRRFAGYRDFDNAPSGPDGIKVRLLVGGEGRAHGVKPEAANLAPETAEALARWVESCRFGFDPTVPGERTDTAYGRVVLAK